MKFRPNNRIKCVQDHGTTWYDRVPPGIDFEVTVLGRGFNLVACGYGCLSNPGEDNCYGNGSLHAWGLSKHQRAMLKKAAKAKPCKPAK